LTVSIGGGLEPGGLFEWATDIGNVRLELLAEVEVAGTALHLRDVAVFPSGTGQAVVGAASLLRILRRELIPHVRAAGFEELRITGTRLSGSRPGRTLDITISLTKDST
jgi:hypothetical protein